MRTTERYSWHNENPYNRNVGDCTVRAISTALDQAWDTTYIGLCLEGYPPERYAKLQRGVEELSEQVWSRAKTGLRLTQR